jgi:hypothetical protein
MSGLTKYYYNNDAFSKHFSFLRKFEYDYKEVAAANKNKGTAYDYTFFEREFNISKLAIFIISAISVITFAPISSTLGVAVTITGLTSTALIAISTLRDIFTLKPNNNNN